jgi:hypothetical protein
VVERHAQEDFVHQPNVIPPPHPPEPEHAQNANAGTNACDNQQRHVTGGSSDQFLQVWVGRLTRAQLGERAWKYNETGEKNPLDAVLETLALRVKDSWWVLNLCIYVCVCVCIYINNSP